MPSTRCSSVWVSPTAGEEAIAVYPVVKSIVVAHFEECITNRGVVVPRPIPRRPGRHPAQGANRGWDPPSQAGTPRFEMHSVRSYRASRQRAGDGVGGSLRFWKALPKVNGRPPLCSGA
jgi:hypothetical protein